MLRLLFRLWQRLQIFNQIALLLRSQSQTKPGVVVIDHIQQSRKSSVVIEAAFVRRLHEQAVLADEEAGEVHCFVNTIRSAVGLKTIDANLGRRVQVPTRLSPKWLDMTVV